MTSVDPAQDPSPFGNAVAAAWERYRQRLFEGARAVSEWLVDQIAPERGAIILELAAGPGETGFLVAERVGSNGRVISTDVAPGMVEAARRGAQSRGLDNVECRVMDAQQIDLPDVSVDGVLSRFGVMFAPDPVRVLSEVRRVLRPGHRLAYAVWGPPERNPWLTLLVGAALQCGHAPPGDPFGPGGVFSLADPAHNLKLLGEAGYSDVRIEEIAGVMRYESIDDYWEFQSAVSGPIALLLASLSSDEIGAIRSQLDPTLAPFHAGSAYEMPSLAVAASATAA
jgi:SAM-dependent methyltransferase